MSLASALTATGVAGEAAVVGLLLLRRVHRKFPIFLIYCASSLLIDSVSWLIRVDFPRAYGIQFYLAESILDMALQFCVLVEVAWSVLRPVRTLLSPMALALISALIVAVGVTIWPFAEVSNISVPSHAWGIMIQLQQTASVVRVLFFLVLAAGSQLLSLGWMDRELQIATGFGIYALVSVVVAILNTHQSTAKQFGDLYLVVAASFLASLLYWVFSFAQKEPVRRAFTPKMRNSLLALAETARVARRSFEDRHDRDSDNVPQEER